MHFSNSYRTYFEDLLIVMIHFYTAFFLNWYLEYQSGWRRMPILGHAFFKTNHSFPTMTLNSQFSHFYFIFFFFLFFFFTFFIIFNFFIFFISTSVVLFFFLLCGLPSLLLAINCLKGGMHSKPYVIKIRKYVYRDVDGKIT